MEWSICVCVEVADPARWTCPPCCPCAPCPPQGLRARRRSRPAGLRRRAGGGRARGRAVVLPPREQVIEVGGDREEEQREDRQRAHEELRRAPHVTLHPALVRCWSSTKKSRADRERSGRRRRRTGTRTRSAARPREARARAERAEHADARGDLPRVGPGGSRGGKSSYLSLRGGAHGVAPALIWLSWSARTYATIAQRSPPGICAA
jgi:hypothetical protein